MPMAKRKPCSFAGCRKLTHSARCERHSTGKWFAEISPERKQRQNMYNRKAWQSMRKMQLNTEPLCAECNSSGITNLATVADHVIPHRGNEDLFNDMYNLQSLCKKCHDNKTARGQ